ncbi:MAG TPA: lysophospholipid acyltransferase family protein [Chryseolinea sp.]|nr:lysophospholipid acyltransferase family protein [Chryseolinea sp.]
MATAKELRRSIQYKAIYVLVRSLIFISHCMSRKSWLWCCGKLGRLTFYLIPQTRQLTLRHLAMVYSEKSPDEITSLAKNVFVMLGKNAGEILRATKVKTTSELNKIMVTHGFENYRAAHAKGKGVIILTCHLGPFDLQVTNMALHGMRPFIIGTPLKDERLNDLLWQQRNALGAVAVERGKETFKLIKALKAGGSLAILIDQDTKVKSRFVNFLGRPASTPVGAAIFAMKTGARVVPTYVYLGEDGFQHMHYLPEIETIVTGNEEEDLIGNTQQYSNFIEEQILKHPEQWVWMHERWKTKPGEEIR